MAKKPASTEARAPQMAEIGVSGLHHASGYLFEEFLPELNGLRGLRTYREMSENDPTVGAVMSAIALVLRAVKWTAEPNQSAGKGSNASAAAEAEAQFAESLFDDMSHSFEDFVAEALSMLPYGWAYHEIVLKRRVGPEERDPTKRSKFTDGRIGVRKLPIRSQDSLNRWEMQADGGIDGMWQLPPMGGPIVFIPIERALLFRPTSRKNSPESVSVLRTAYRPWFFLKRIQEIEAIGIERELAGLPVVSIPAKYLLPDAPPADKAVLAQYMKIARDLKFNEQGALVIPSNTYPNADGSPSGVPMVKIELLKAGGPRAINTAEVKLGYQRDIARSILADFIMLGTDKGAFNLSESKTSLFFRACEAFLGQIAAVLNRFLLPRIWALNGLDHALLPTMKPGRLAAVDLGILGSFMQAMSAAGATLFPDEDLENFLRDEASLPAKSPEAIAEQEAAQSRKDEVAAEAARSALAGRTAPEPNAKAPA